MDEQPPVEPRQPDAVRSRTIKRVPGTGIVEVRYAGEISYEYRIETLDALERASPNGEIHRLLINYTSAWPAPQRQPHAVREFARRLGLLGFASDARVALVNAPSDVATKTEASASPGGYLFRSFDDRAQAIAWLSEPN